MSNYILEPVVSSAVVNQALIEVDFDTNTERVVILNRETMVCYYNTKVTANPFKAIVPFTHTFNNTLLVGILDDDGVFNAAFADGVEPQIIDGSAIDIKT
ncbi:hypothetical protein [Shewanella psychrotolerans]|uniref:hypothetical protein n=1 Tax=Shewanella psychrotolerans TaxID=2864206 RepID=UPI001C655FCA|nr:hypothetical protein [Shewanella psychrotolerans]QYK02804.1 hypothetical protein K0I62_07655 [Shewanella psychrotolerans]